MNEISFSGGFLIEKPSRTVWANIQSVMPKHKCVFQDFNENGDKFFAVKTYNDAEMANVILRKKVRFKFFPDINLKSRLDTYHPEEARKIVGEQNNVIETKEELRKYLKKIKPVIKKQNWIERYRWTPDDHIEKTYRAIGLNPEEYVTQILDGITYIKDKTGRIVAKASPNNERGINYVYVYSKNNDDSSRKLVITQGGEIEELGAFQYKVFFNNFMRNVKIDNARKRPQK